MAASGAGDIDVARQSLADGVWRSALEAADLAATNATDRTAARLVSLEALARLGDDAEIRRRLTLWKDERGDAFRFWRARSLIRVGDFRQAAAMLEKPFSDPWCELPVKCLKAYLLASGGDRKAAIEKLSSSLPPESAGAAGEEARLMLGELLSAEGRTAEAVGLLAPLAGKAAGADVKLRAGYLLGFAEMAGASTRTAGVARVRRLLRASPGEKVSIQAARAFADRLLESGDAAGADDEYRRYLETNPAAAMDAEVLFRRGQALYLLGQRSEAAGAFARAEQMATNAADRARFAFSQSETLLAEGRYGEAAAGFARSAGYGAGDRLQALFAEADARERAGETVEAERLYGALAKGGGRWGAKARIRLAAGEARKGRLAKAIDDFGKLFAETNLLSREDATEIHLGRGRACYRDYRFADAEKDFEMVASRDPSRADAMRFLSALCKYGAGRDVDAKAAVVSLMASTTNRELRADLTLWCAKYEFNKGDFAESRTHFEKYASMRTNTVKAVEALLWAARCASEQTDYSKAVELATQAAAAADASGPLFAEALLVQGEAIMELGRYPEAAQVFDRIVTRFPDGPNSAKAAALKADALYAMGAGDLNRYEEAISAYRSLPEGANLSPDRRIEVEFKIGRALEKLRRTREAMDQYYRRVVLAYVEDVNKGIMFGAPARTFFARAAFSFADHHEAIGDFAAARSVLEKVAGSDVPASEEAKRRLDELKRKGGGQ